jgi:hypothetical protein
MHEYRKHRPIYVRIFTSQIPATLNCPHITSKFRTVPMFVIVRSPHNSQSLTCVQLNCFYKTCRTFEFSGSLVMLTGVNYYWRCKNYPYNRPWRPGLLWDVKASTFYRQSAHRWRWGCPPHAPAALYHQEDSWYTFLLETESTPVP